MREKMWLTFGNAACEMKNFASVTRLRLRTSTTADAASEVFSRDMPGRLRGSNALAKEPGARAKCGQALRSNASTSCGMQMAGENCAKAVTPMV